MESAGVARHNFAPFPTIGSPEIPVLLVEFKDVKFATPLPHESISRLLNDSVRGYFIENSDSLFAPTFKVFGPVTLRRPELYYGWQQGIGADAKAWAVVADAIEQLGKSDGATDFAQFDSNGDGIVDNLAIIFAGKAQTDGGPAWSIWPHSANMQVDHKLDIDIKGVEIGNYTMVGEPAGSTGVATFSHELMSMARLFGQAGEPAGPGWINASGQPLGAFERINAGWLKPRTIAGSETITLADISVNSALRLDCAGSADYYLLENRRPPLTGAPALMVWHIDGSSNNVTAFSHIDDAAAEVRLAISDLTTLDNGSIRFNFNGGGHPVAPVEIDQPTDITPTSFVARWQPRPGTSAFEIDICRGLSAIPVATLSAQGNASSIEVKELEPSETYRYTVRAVEGRNKSHDSAEASLTTLDQTFDMLKTVAMPPTAVESNAFRANWQPVDDADGYVLSVYRKLTASPRRFTAGFSGSYPLPDGWTSRSATPVGVKDYYGEAAPSMQLTGQFSFVESREFDADITSLSFWIKGLRIRPQSSLMWIEGKIDGHWTTMATIAEFDNLTGTTLAWSGNGQQQLPKGVRAIRIGYSATDNSALFIDDVDLTVGATETLQYVDGFDHVNVGNTTWQVIEGLDSSTTYHYRVQAVSGDESASPSVETAALTLGAATGVTTPSMPVADDVTIVPTPDGVAITNHTATVQGAVCTTASGSLIHSGNVNPGATVTIQLPHNGIYVVRCHTAHCKLLR